MTKRKKKGPKKDVQAEWNQYFGTNDNDLAKWQQLGRDLGIAEEALTSKTRIRKVSTATMGTTHVYMSSWTAIRPAPSLPRAEL